MKLKALLLTFLFLLLPFVSVADEAQERLPTVLCDIIDHPIYKNTIVFGSGKRELFLFKEDKANSLLHYENFKLIMNDQGYFAINKENDEVLLSISSEGQKFIKINGAEPTKYEISNCILITD